MAVNRDRDCQQCEALTKSRRRCKRRTCKYSKQCYQHTLINKGLSLGKSKIPNSGLGLYAEKKFKRGDRIASYGGVIVSSSDFKSSDSAYGLQVSNGEVLDSRSTQSGLGRYVNDCRASNKRRRQCKGKNSRLVWNSRSRTASVKATKTIQPGTEIYTSYGRGYWDG